MTVVHSVTTALLHIQWLDVAHSVMRNKIINARYLGNDQNFGPGSGCIGQAKVFPNFLQTFF